MQIDGDAHLELWQGQSEARTPNDQRALIAVGTGLGETMMIGDWPTSRFFLRGGPHELRALHDVEVNLLRFTQ